MYVCVDLTHILYFNDLLHEFFVALIFSVTAEYARGVGLIERSAYTLSVQFLNRVSYVTGEFANHSIMMGTLFPMHILAFTAHAHTYSH